MPKGICRTEESKEKQRRAWDGKRNPVGNSHTLYRCWANMKSRCLKPKHPAYKHYGERGIKICDRWLVFKNFYDDVHEDYFVHSKLHGGRQTSLDRINNNGDYEPENCTWSTSSEQGFNRREHPLSEEKRMREIANKLLKKKKKEKRKNFLKANKIDPNISRLENVLKMRRNGLTLQDIGAKFGVTRERIRQIEVKAKIIEAESELYEVSFEEVLKFCTR